MLKTVTKHQGRVLTMSALKTSATWRTLQKLPCPNHTHHLPSTEILYHLLPRPVTSHLLWLLRTSPRHTAFYPRELQQYVILSSVLLAFIKVINVCVWNSIGTPNQPHPPFLCFSGSLWATFTVFRDFFSCLISSIEGRQNPAGITNWNKWTFLLWGVVFVLLGYLNIIFHLSHRTH